MSIAPAEVTIREVDADEALALIDGLVEVTRDSVAGGFSINFLEDVTLDELRQYWLGSIAEQRAAHRVLFVAEVDGFLAGTVMLLMAPQPNQPHRGEVSKMLVHSSCRRRGIGLLLLQTVETAARAHGRTLLMLDTTTGLAGDHLYRAAGWTYFGEVPGHALMPDGQPSDTSFFFKQLEP